MRFPSRPRNQVLRSCQRLQDAAPLPRDALISSARAAAPREEVVEDHHPAGHQDGHRQHRGRHAPRTEPESPHRVVLAGAPDPGGCERGGEEHRGRRGLPGHRRGAVQYTRSASRSAPSPGRCSRPRRTPPPRRAPRRRGGRPGSRGGPAAPGGGRGSPDGPRAPPRQDGEERHGDRHGGQVGQVGCQPRGRIPSCPSPSPRRSRA